MVVRKRIIKFLLWILNTHWINQSPCEYGFIGNVDAFSYENLADEEKQSPGITVKEILEAADRFKTCPMRQNGLTVIEGDGTLRDGTIWDVHELRQDIAKARAIAKEKP